MAKPSKAKVLEEAKTLGLDVSEKNTVKEIQALIAEEREGWKDSSIGKISVIVPDKPVEATPAPISITPIAVFPSASVRRLPSHVRLPHRGIVPVEDPPQ